MKSEASSKKYNVVDFLALALALLLIIGIVYRCTSDMTETIKTNVKVEYTIKVHSIKDVYVAALEKGGALRSSGGTYDMGEILSVASSGATETVVGDDAVAVVIDILDRYDAYVTISSEAKETETGYTLPDGTVLALERSVSVLTKYVGVTGTVTELNVIGTDE